MKISTKKESVVPPHLFRHLKWLPIYKTFGMLAFIIFSDTP